MTMKPITVRYRTIKPHCRLNVNKAHAYLISAGIISAIVLMVASAAIERTLT